jgi:hypothetical protein
MHMEQKMILKRFRLILRMEWMKTWCRLNIVVSLIVFILVLTQIAFLVRLDPDVNGAYLTAALINNNAARYINNLAFTFIPVLFLINTGREFDYAIVQRSLVSGISRPGFFNGKLIQLGLFSLLASILAIILSVLAAVIHEVEMIWDLRKLLMYFVVAFSLGSFALMIVFAVQKRSYALAILVAYIILENTITAIFQSKTILLPFQTCIRLLRHGIYQLPEMIMTALYTIIFLAIAYRVFRQSDLR